MVPTRGLVRMFAATALAVSLAACSTSGGNTGSPASVEGTGALDGGGKTIVAFTVSTANNYVNAMTSSMKDEAAKFNYKLKIIENNFDQTQEDQQVRQFLASGEDAAAFIYWPATNESGVNSSRLLSARGPVIQVNSRILPEAEPYITAYAGADHPDIGKTMGEQAVKIADADKAAGRQFHGPDGKPNILEITFRSGYQVGIDRSQGFFGATGDTFNLLATEHVTTADAQGGFTAASQIIPKAKSQGIDYVVAGSNNMAVGVARALLQNGLEPGKDVKVIAGDFSGDKQPLLNGQIESAVLQSPVIDGKLAMQTVARYLATGKATDETVRVPVEANEPEVTATPPAKVTYMPNPVILRDGYNQFTFWGLGIDQLEF